MSLKIRRLHINVYTSDGPYGAELVLEDGLNILHAENSMGKSTCVQAIIYALGLERMLGPKSDIPLTPAVTALLEDDAGEHVVLESEIFLEIENSSGKFLTIRRPVKGLQDSRLVTVWDGPRLSHPTIQSAPRDYFVRDPGSATREAGFHYLLTRFIDVELPNVTRNNGTDGILYLEGVFPLFFVEQKHGWGGIQANLPTYLGIRELGKRALEFVLNLDAASIEVKRHAIQKEETELVSRWKELFSELQYGIQSLPGRVKGFPQEPQAAWPPEIAPKLEVARAGQWIEFSYAFQVAREELSTLNTSPTPSADAVADKASIALVDALDRLATVEQIAQLTSQDLENEQSQSQVIRIRISALEQDLQRNADAEKLRKLGSVADWNVIHDTCPTCHQHVEDTLLSQDNLHAVMSVESNIEFIKSQLSTFKKLQEGSQQVVASKSQILDGLRLEMTNLRAQVRALRQTLTSASDAPAASVVRRQLELEMYESKLQKVEEHYAQSMEQFSDVASRWLDMLRRKAQLPTDGLSINDRRKLKALEDLVRKQLVEYGFKSIPADSVSISPDNYRPTREGFNLGFDLSASDNIRIIWAYLEGLFELARSQDFSTNHAGVLLFDEPRQQEAKEISFAKLLERAAKSKQFGQQVIFATSEKLSELKLMTDGLEVKILSFDGRVITRKFEAEPPEA